ncbi:polysaccharide synthase [Xylariales sp. AK1849]|nr:polysaccharide synthase [Xylariales sp. AK1849]
MPRSGRWETLMSWPVVSLPQNLHRISVETLERRLVQYVDGLVKAHYASKYKPTTIGENPTYASSTHVSIIVTTLKPPAVFTACLYRWLDNDPLEVIITTTPKYFDEVTETIQAAKLPLRISRKIRVIHIDEGLKGQREQLKLGIEAARGDIIAVSDDQIFWSTSLLEHMLPCFDDDNVGGVGGPIDVYITPERRDKGIVTPWEAAGAKYLFGGRGGGPAMYAAARWTWCLAGCTYLARADILKDPAFLHGFTHDNWFGAPLDTGGDNFISRWLIKRNWIIAVQYKDEVRVWRTLKTTRAYIDQRLRWERSTIHSYLCFLFFPRVYHHPYVAFHTWKRILRVPLGIAHLLLYAYIGLHYRHIALALVMANLWQAYQGYPSFLAAYPYMSRPTHILAAVACDYSGLLIGLCGWFTLSSTTWLAGEERRVAKSITQHGNEDGNKDRKEV